MWGNRLGWILAGALVVVMIIAIAAAYVVTGKRTEPTAFSQDPANLAVLELPRDPRQLLPTQRRDADAGAVYWRAVEDYQKNITEYERLTEAFDAKRAVALDGVKAVLEAADYRKASLFDGRIEAAVGYGSRPGVNALHRVGAVVARLGTDYAQKRQFDEARKYLLASYALGFHLYDQRMSRLQLTAGLGLMAQSATVLKQIENADGKTDAGKRYDEFVSSYQKYYTEHVEPMERVLTSVDPKVLANHVGDVFVIVDKSQERVWRVEGVLKLGMYKYYTNTAGDRRAAVRTVKSLLKDPDPAVAAAALAARELTIAQYRTIGSR